MFHNTIDGELPQSVPTLTEYIKGKGYFTSKLDGDWRGIYSYGFARGCDQYVYQIQSMGARAEQEIINAIEHIEAFKDTDQYLWMTVGDLHDIADGYDLSLAVQKKILHLMNWNMKMPVKRLLNKTIAGEQKVRGIKNYSVL